MTKAQAQAILERLAYYFDERRDVSDGPDSQPTPNEAAYLYDDVVKLQMHFDAEDK